MRSVRIVSGRQLLGVFLLLVGLGVTAYAIYQTWPLFKHREHIPKSDYRANVWPIWAGWLIWAVPEIVFGIILLAR